MPSVNRGIYHWLFSGVAALEDFADRLSHVWTFAVLLVFSAVISWRQQLFNAPIVCVTPSQFTGSLVAYAHAACWNMNSKYSIPQTELIPVDIEQRHERIWTIQWLPVILCIQAVLFKFPSLLMYILHGYSGVSFEKVAGLTEGYQNLNLIERAYLGKQTGRYLYNWCKQCESCLPWRMLSLSWLLAKILFCVNVLVQLVLVDRMLSPRNAPFDNSTSNAVYGLSFGDVIRANLFSKGSAEWVQSPVFPRTILCDYGIRQLHNIQRYTLQCDITVSEFNEYICMLIWIWLLFVTVVSWLSLVVWVISALLPFFRERYISKMLELSEELNANQLNKLDVSRFTSMVGEDGVMVLKLMASNSSELLVRDAVTTMFQMKMAHRYPQQAFPLTQQFHQSAPLLTSEAAGRSHVAAGDPNKP